jgi:hypothetical protein
LLSQTADRGYGKGDYAWLDRLPPWLQVSVICTIFVGVTWLGIVAGHPFLRRLLHRMSHLTKRSFLTRQLWSVLRSAFRLLTIETFQSTKDVIGTTDRDASNLSTLSSAADGYPDPLLAQLKGELRDYARTSSARTGRPIEEASCWRGSIGLKPFDRRCVLSFAPTTKTQEVLQGEIQRYLDAMGVAREQRLSAVR